MLRVRRAVAIVVFLGVATLPALSMAQSQSATEEMLAREQFNAGIAAVESGHWLEARDAFARAYALDARPLILLNLAGAQAHTGQFLAASISYRRFLASAGTDVGATYVVAAREALANCERRLAHVRLGVVGAREGDRVLLDGALVPPAAIGAAIPLDPGEHVFSIVNNQHRDVGRVTVRLGEGQAVDTALRASLPREPVQRWLAPTARERRMQRETRHAAIAPWFWVAIGAVVIAGAAATITAIALSNGDVQGSIPPYHLTVP
jgi:hypothetical protein